MNKEFNIADSPFEFALREIWARMNKKRIINYLDNLDLAEAKLISEYIKKNGISVFPYEFCKNYNRNMYELSKDSSHFVVKNIFGYDLYLKKTFKSSFHARNYINNLMIEQDVRSPHQYVSETFKPDSDSVLIDIGGAEGIFSLKYVETVKEIYIFECDKNWVEALEKTFKKWKHKVHVINRFVADYTDDSHISLDDFLRDNNLCNEKLFIKVDAEGNEIRILEGANNMLSGVNDILISICVYHKQNHEDIISKKLSDWNIQPANNYMLYYYDCDFSEPFLRHGVIRCKNKL